MTARRALILGAALFLWNLWGTDLAAPDEPYFGEGAREMVVDGQWAVPHVNGTVTTDKPPLFFWLIALVSLPLGRVTSFTARLPSALAMLGTVALTMRLGRRLLGERAGVLGGFLLVTTYLAWDKARSSQTDALLCFFIVVALSAFEGFRAGDARPRRAGLLFWLAIALAVLTKGPVGLLLPLGIALLTLAWDRDLARWRAFAPLSGPLLFGGVLAAWVVLATIGGHGEYSVWGAFKEHALSRAVHGLHHPQPPWYYLEVLPVQLLPWTGLVPAGLLLAARRRGRSERFLLVWAFFVILFFSISTEKRDLYVLPAYPALLLLAAAAVAAWESARELDRSRVLWPHAAVGAVLVLVGIALPFLAARRPLVPLWIAVLLGAVLAAGSGASLMAALRDRLLPSLAWMGGGVAAAYLVGASLLQPALDPLRSARSFAATLETTTAASRNEGHEVLAYRLGNLPEAFAFYTNGVYLRETYDADALARHLAQEATVFAVADESHLADLPGSVRERLVVSASAPLSRMKVVLVGNQGRPSP